MSGVVLLRSAGGGGGTSDITISTINGQLVPTFEDTSRSKQLSVADNVVSFSDNRLRDLQWMSVGNASDASTGYIVDMDATIVRATATCIDADVNIKEIHLYVNGTDEGVIGSLGPGNNVSFINNSINVDADQGDLIRLQVEDVTGTGPIEDTVVKLTVKWRV